jgi:two-component system alkaline phosphatase synthesis response regulator PhoP
VAAQETEKNDKPLTDVSILVVDDDPDALIFTRAVLEDNGASVSEAENGDDALALMRERKPDLVTLDLGMPGKDGIEVFCEMRDDPALADIPVCIITGRPELRKLIYERVASRPPEGYLNKPVNDITLMRNVRKILGIKKHPKNI